MPLLQVPVAATIRVYRTKAGEPAIVPQGGAHRGLASRSDLRREAIVLWEAEAAAYEAKAIPPAYVVTSAIGPDLLMVSLQHPDAGVLRTTIIAVEPA